MGICPISFEGRKVSCPNTLLRNIKYMLLKKHLTAASILHCDKQECLSSVNCICHLLLAKGLCIGVGRGDFVSELPPMIPVTSLQNHLCNLAEGGLKVLGYPNSAQVASTSVLNA